MRAIRRLVDKPPRGEVVLYVDEVDIHLYRRLRPDWMLSGKQKYVLTPGCNEKRYLAGALNPKTGKGNLGGRRSEEQLVVPPTPSQACHEDIPFGPVGSILFSITTAYMTAAKFNWR